MIKEIISIEKRTYIKRDKKYFLYLLPDTSAGKKVLSIYIQKEGYSLMSFNIDLSTDENSPSEIEELIEANLTSFIEVAEHDTHMLEINAKLYLNDEPK